MQTTGETARNERRRSFGLVFSRFKDAMKRRSSSGRSLATAQTVSSQTPAPTLAMDTPATSSAPERGDVLASRTLPPHAEQPAPDETTVTSDAPLILQTGEVIEVGDGDEHEPATTPIRLDSSSSRAKAIFERYGITYQTNDTVNENRKRVRKAVRIRIHWTCHQCQTGFGTRKVCANCQHQRCQQCGRSPHRRVREALKGTAMLKELDQKVADSSEDQETIVVPVTSSDQQVVDPVIEADRGSESVERSSKSALNPLGPFEKLEKDDNTSGDDIDIAHIKYVIQHRTRSGVQMVLRPKTQIIRRICHECQAHFKPANRSDCQECGHQRCSLCPRHPAKPHKWPLGSPGDEPAPDDDSTMTVQRVYRKPRQRVRWVCHECSSVFPSTHACPTCQHLRCPACTRSPPIRTPPPPDPAVLQAVADRIAEVNETLVAQSALQVHRDTGPSIAPTNLNTAIV